jgi:hypothetical protein
LRPRKGCVVEAKRSGGETVGVTWRRWVRLCADWWGML